MRSITEESFEIGTLAFVGVVVGISNWDGVVLTLWNWPWPLKIHKRSISGKAVRTLEINSRLGLFLPLSIWEILERCTVMVSAKVEADKL